MTSNRISFEDIQTSDLLYYDPEFKENCFLFCQERDIDCLPALDDPLKFYQRTENGFSEELLKSERIVNGETSIFEPLMLGRFRASPIIFISTRNEMTGVVHFSDYNKPVVDSYLFSVLSAYERLLRKLLLMCELKNQDMVDYFGSKVETTKSENTRSIYREKISGYRKKQPRNDKLPAFECFYMLDLIELARFRKIIILSQDANVLRNMVMHAHDLIIKDDPNRDDHIYTFASFEKFFNQVNRLLLDYKKVNNKIAFLELSGGKA